MRVKTFVAIAFVVLSSLVACGLTVTLRGATPQPTPMPGMSVHDFADVISPDKEAEIQAKAFQLKEKYKTEVALVTVKTTSGEPAFDYSLRLARAWGIGSKEEESRGLLVLVATEDHTTSFRTSRHIEGEFTDGVTGTISREMNGYFKRGDFGGGLSRGMDMILAREAEVFEAPKPPTPTTDGSSTGWWILGLLGLGVGIAGLLYWKFNSGDEETMAKPVTITGFVPTENRSREFQRPSPTYSSLEPRFKERLKTKAQPSPTPVARQAAKGDDEEESSGLIQSVTSYTPPSPSYSNDDSSSSSSSSSDSGISTDYGGSSDFGGGGSDSSW
jgi:uncharacterized membrane protein YgcG